MVGELLLLAAVSFGAGFGVGWSLRAALARADRQDEIVPLEWVGPEKFTNNVERYLAGFKEYYQDRGNRS